MNFVIKMSLLVILAIVVSCSAGGHGGGGHGGGGHGGGGHGGGGHGGGGHGGGGYGYKPQPFDFAYGVQDSYTGSNFGHSESADAYNNRKGQYYVNLPDGRVQKVSYFTDEWGYHPTITYEGKAHFPSHGAGHGGGGGYH